MTTTAAPIDREFSYPGFHGRPARCRIRVYRRGPDRPTVVIATELADNPGTSVTNRAETVAAMVCREFGIDPGTLLWVEHYGPWRHLGESFSLVEFQAGREPGELCRPCWHPTTKAAVERLIGSPLAD